MATREDLEYLVDWVKQMAESQEEISMLQPGLDFLEAEVFNRQAKEIQRLAPVNDAGRRVSLTQAKAFLRKHGDNPNGEYSGRGRQE